MSKVYEHGGAERFISNSPDLDASEAPRGAVRWAQDDWVLWEAGHHIGPVRGFMSCRGCTDAEAMAWVADGVRPADAKVAPPERFLRARLRARCLTHLLDAEELGGKGRSLCGVEPGRLSSGWGPHVGTDRVCARCARQAAMRGAVMAGVSP